MEGKQNKSAESTIRSNVLKILSMEDQAKRDRSFAEKLAEHIANFCGSMAFVYIHVIWFGGWIFVNTATPYVFDKFPFTFLTLVVSLEAIFLSTFILISQNHETRLTERRNHLDLQINMLAEQESTKTLELVQLIAKQVGVKDDDPLCQELLRPMDPEKLLKEIQKHSDHL